MKKALIVALSVLVLVTAASATLVTNNNQSALFLRLPSRAASVDVDAVYYNPAGLAVLKDGWHFSLNNQSISQTKTVDNAFLFLATAPTKAKWTRPCSRTFMPSTRRATWPLVPLRPRRGGGSARVRQGPALVRVGVARPSPPLSAKGITTTKYAADIDSKGSPIYSGFQFNVSYALSETISAAIGARYVSASNTYEGHIQNVQINPNFLPMASSGPWSPRRRSSPRWATPPLPPPCPTRPSTEQTASGFTPILSLDFHPMDNLNIALKYEFETKLEFTNETTKDDVGMFPNGAKTRLDIPAFLSVGANYGIMKELRATASFDYSSTRPPIATVSRTSSLNTYGPRLRARVRHLRLPARQRGLPDDPSRRHGRLPGRPGLRPQRRYLRRRASGSS